MAYRISNLRLDRDQALRTRILDCAMLRVAEGGFANLTMQALAEDVGVATGSLYRHFSSKGELAAQVFVMASQREVAALASAFSAPGAPGVASSASSVPPSRPSTLSRSTTRSTSCAATAATTTPR